MGSFLNLRIIDAVSVLPTQIVWYLRAHKQVALTKLKTVKTQISLTTARHQQHKALAQIRPLATTATTVNGFHANNPQQQ